MMLTIEVEVEGAAAAVAVAGYDDDDADENRCCSGEGFLTERQAALTKPQETTIDDVSGKAGGLPREVMQL